jgi:cell division protease FtsH
MAILVRNLFIFFIILACLFLAGIFLTLETRLPARDYSELVEHLNNNEVASIDLTGSRADVDLKSGFRYSTRVPDARRFLADNPAARVRVAYHEDYTLYYFQGGIFAFALALAFVIWLSTSSAKGEAQGSKFASDKLSDQSSSRERVTFDDVAGVPEAKEELQEVVSFLKNPLQFNNLGAIMPRGLLLQGPPGTGKTLLAKAIAGEAGVPFYSFSGSDFVEMFVGVGASRVRDLFKEAKKNTPCIVFIDEIDAVGSSRSAASTDGQDERGQTLNALLVEMDGFGSTDNIIVLAATNRPDILDPALSRPGRFDRRITLLPPDIKGRIKILQVHSRKVVLSPEIDIEELARMTSGFTGAELANYVNEAALLAGRDNCDSIAKSHFDQALDRIMLGVERKGLIITDKDKQIIAYHEAGHAIIAKMLPDSDPVHKITIMPRGRALGQTQQLPISDRTAYSKEYLTNRITTLLGGRAAEKIIFNSRTTRTENDLLQATEIATNMVCRWGMSEALGAQAYAVGDNGFLSQGATSRLHMGNDTVSLIDREIKGLLTSCYKQALEILQRERLFLKTLSEILCQVETLDAEEFEIIYQCSITKKAQENGTVEKVSECSVCPARGNCLQYHDRN